MIDMIKWSKFQYSTNLNRWCGNNGLAPSFLFTWSKEDPEFRAGLEEVKANLAANREEMVASGALHQACYTKSLHVYDRITYEQWKEEKEFEASVNAKSEAESSKSITINAVKEPWKHGNN
jgi:hypothetical protein